MLTLNRCGLKLKFLGVQVIKRQLKTVIYISKKYQLKKIVIFSVNEKYSYFLRWTMRWSAEMLHAHCTHLKQMQSLRPFLVFCTEVGLYRYLKTATDIKTSESQLFYLRHWPNSNLICWRTKSKHLKKRYRPNTAAHFHSELWKRATTCKLPPTLVWTNNFWNTSVNYYLKSPIMFVFFL